MNFEICVIPGRSFQHKETIQTRSIGRSSFGPSATSFAGSYQIRDMGRHFEDYIVRPQQVGLIGGQFHGSFPPNFAYQPLLDKQRSPGVIGNIGETVCGIVGLRALGLRAIDIVHIRATTPKRAPDFVFNIASLPTAFHQIADRMEIPASAMEFSPNWWPAEAKTTKRANHVTPFDDAFIQLVCYWRECSRSDVFQHSMGYGLIIITGYESGHRNINVFMLIPRNQCVLARYLQMTGVSKKTAADSKLASHLLADSKVRLRKLQETMFYGIPKV
ncbi:hypothetical protein Mal15_28480 [Stieleria maiorica]|uniref:Uncharacterized protein n=1 Tax=Stieleria maiorica TaxID=2795974 RepID=A0A5B9MC55_9BACT|nr:hypothetical protein [Stieleria maiorica]QEF98792.1 hypothetical protein Mal15_28480 [Stieleria maiorica]